MSDVAVQIEILWSRQRENNGNEIVTHVKATRGATPGSPPRLGLQHMLRRDRVHRPHDDREFVETKVGSLSE